MKKIAFFSIAVLAVFFSAANIHAQQGFIGQQNQPGFTGQQAAFPGIPGHQGFFGPSQSITVSQVLAFPHKASAVLTGNIVASFGNDRFLFRDSSGEIVIKIKSNRWWGLSVGANDRVEIGGELKRDKRTGLINYFDAKVVRRAQ